MTLKAALRWSLYDRALALGPLLLGIAVAGIGLWIGAGVYLEELMFGDPSDADAPASTPIAIAGIVLGVLVWQIGRGAVRHYTLQAADVGAAGGAGSGQPEPVEPSSAVRDTIADLENDVQALNRKTTRIEQELHGDALGNDELAPTGSDSEGSGTAGTTTSNAATAGGAQEETSVTGAPDSQWPGADDTGESQDRSIGSGGTEQVEEATAGAEAGANDATEAGADGDADRTEDEQASDDAEAESDDSPAGFEWEEDEDGEYYRNT